MPKDPASRQDTNKPLLVLATLALVTIGTLVGLFAAEAAYRFYIFDRNPERFETLSSDGGPQVWYFHTSPWKFNAAFGYEYVPGVADGGSASNGRVDACWDFPVNEQGNIGVIEGSYEDADLKVLVFGDSFTAQPHEGLTWPNVLQRSLNDELGHNSHVVNYGRDGYGILQMFDLAAARVPEMKPDLVVFAFISDDITRNRFWRTYTTIDGRERILTTTEPSATPSLDVSADTAIVHSGATRAWCEAAVASKRVGDPILREMEETARWAQNRTEQRADIFTLDQSYLLDRIVHGSPFHRALQRLRPAQNPRHSLTDFSQDPGFARSVEILKNSGVPIMVIHHATLDEIRRGEEYIVGDRERGLLGSIESALGVQIRETLPMVTKPAADLDSIIVSPGNQHPSRVGLDFYADITAKHLQDLLPAPAKR